MSERDYTTSWEDGVWTKTFNDDPENPTVFQIKFDDLPEISQNYAKGYGLTQCINDRHAGAKSIKEKIESTRQMVEDLENGVIRRRASGLGLGVDLEKLTEALANVNYNGDKEQAKAALANFIPDMENDDEDLVKEKKKRLRQIQNLGAVKVELDRMSGKSAEDLLSAPLTVAQREDAEGASA